MRIRTVISRGGRPLSMEDLKPNEVYSVRVRILTEEEAKTHGSFNDQWGVVMLDHVCRVRRSYNCVAPFEWYSGAKMPKYAEFYPSTKMERQFAINSELLERYHTLYDSTREELNDLKLAKIKSNRNIIQRIANWLMGV